MSRFQELQTRHLALLAAYEQDTESKDLLSDVQAFIEQVVVASKEISDSRERNQLRANLRFWGAFIYDHTRVYPPNLTLLPAKKAPAPFRRIAGIVSGIVLFLIVLLIVYLSLSGSKSAQHSLLTQTVNARLTGTAIGPATQTETPTLPPTVTPLPTETSTAVSYLPTPTSPPIFSPTPFGTPGSDFLYPVTGGGGAPYEVVKYEQADCSSRSLKINFSALFQTNELVTITLYRSGSGEIAKRQVVIEDESGNGSALFSLTDPTEDTLYLLDAKNSVLQSQMVILQFLSNCTRNKMVVDLDLSIPVGEPPFDSQVILLTWAADYVEPAWLAEFKISNNNTGVFWLVLVDETDPDNPVTQPIDDAFQIKTNLCESAYFELVETTGGIYRKQIILLYSPMSFCP